MQRFLMAARVIEACIPMTCPDGSLACLATKILFSSIAGPSPCQLGEGPSQVDKTCIVQSGVTHRDFNSPQAVEQVCSEWPHASKAGLILKSSSVFCRHHTWVQLLQQAVFSLLLTRYASAEDLKEAQSFICRERDPPDNTGCWWPDEPEWICIPT